MCFATMVCKLEYDPEPCGKPINGWRIQATGDDEIEPLRRSSRTFGERAMVDRSEFETSSTGLPKKPLGKMFVSQIT